MGGTWGKAYGIKCGAIYYGSNLRTTWELQETGRVSLNFVRAHSKNMMQTSKSPQKK
jgi:hypothetical protein